MKTIEERAKEFTDGLQFGIFDSLGNKKMFCDLLTMFAEKYLSDNEAEIARLRTALDEANKRCEIAEKVIAQKNAEPRGAKDVELQTASLDEDIEKAFNIATKEEINGETYILASDVKCMFLLAKYHGMTLNHYQDIAMTTCLPSSANDCYMLFGLVEEVGELCGKVSKGIRKGWVSVDDNFIYRASDDGTYDECVEQIKSECGDVLWMLAGLSRQFCWRLEDVAQYNLDKLAKRKDSGTIVTHEDH